MVWKLPFLMDEVVDVLPLEIFPHFKHLDDEMLVTIHEDRLPMMDRALLDFSHVNSFTNTLEYKRGVTFETK